VRVRAADVCVRARLMCVCALGVVQDMVEDVRDHVAELVHTGKGAQVAMRCLAYGTVKVCLLVVHSSG
jgi:hypothetical protein